MVNWTWQAVLLAYTMLIRYMEVLRTLRQHRTEKPDEVQRNLYSAIMGALCVVRAPYHARAYFRTFIWVSIFSPRLPTAPPALVYAGLGHLLPCACSAASRCRPPPQVGALGVCAVPFHASMVGHTIFAVVFFVTGSIWSYLQNWIDRETGLASTVPGWVRHAKPPPKQPLAWRSRP